MLSFNVPEIALRHARAVLPIVKQPWEMAVTNFKGPIDITPSEPLRSASPRPETGVPYQPKPPDTPPPTLKTRVPPPPPLKAGPKLNPVISPSAKAGNPEPNPVPEPVKPTHVTPPLPQADAPLAVPQDTMDDSQGISPDRLQILGSIPKRAEQMVQRSWGTLMSNWGAPGAGVNPVARLKEIIGDFSGIVAKIRTGYLGTDAAVAAQRAWHQTLAGAHTWWQRTVVYAAESAAMWGETLAGSAAGWTTPGFPTEWAHVTAGAWGRMQHVGHGIFSRAREGVRAAWDAVGLAELHTAGVDAIQAIGRHVGATWHHVSISASRVPLMEGFSAWQVKVRRGLLAGSTWASCN